MLQIFNMFMSNYILLLTKREDAISGHLLCRICNKFNKKYSLPTQNKDYTKDSIIVFDYTIYTYIIFYKKRFYTLFHTLYHQFSCIDIVILNILLDVLRKEIIPHIAY